MQGPAPTNEKSFYAPQQQQQPVYQAQYPPVGTYQEPAQGVTAAAFVVYQETEHPQQPLVSSNPTFASNDSSDQTALILMIVGFFMGWVWLVNYFLHRNATNAQAKKYANISGILFLLAIGFSVLCVSLYLLFFFIGLLPFLTRAGK